jgi:hypothetical protein
MNGDTNSHQDDEPKIIVDSDWKEQIAREKEQSAEPVDQVAKESEGEESGEAMPPPPPATFEVLVSMLFTQAMSLLGQLPDPSADQASINKPYAKHYIDTLEMLSEKTKGNLTSDETEMVSEALHALRMTYVNVKSAGP